MQSKWLLPVIASAAQPPSDTAGEPPPSLPPDPPDPSSPLTPEAATSILQSLYSGEVSKQVDLSKPTFTVPSGSEITTSHILSPQTFQTTHTPNLHTTITIPPKYSSPIHTNRASSGTNPTLTHHHPDPPSLEPITNQTQTQPPKQPKQTQPTLIEKLRTAGDKTLKRLAPVSVSPSGRPRILIPDSVFQKGADLHKDFVVCYFNGKPPPFNQIQSVFNYMWGKGKRLEIHNNPLNRESMFHTAQWSSEHSMSTPPLKAIKIWAHLTGVPLDLRYDEGLSLVAGPVGEPKETDDFTKNLVSLTVSHVKVEVDLTKPLPDVVEFERQNGEVVEVMVHYPWVPPTCSHCHELGHIIKNCLHYTPPPKAAPEPPSGAKKQDVKRQQKYQSKAKPSEQGSAVTPSPTPTVLPPDPVSHFEAALPVSKLAPSVAIVTDTMSPLPLSSSLVRSSSNAPPVFSSPDPPPRPSLKRSSSSSTLSPSHQQLKINSLLSLTAPFEPSLPPQINIPLENKLNSLFSTSNSFASLSSSLIPLELPDHSGLNDPNKHRPFVSWLNSHSPLFGAILETHISEPSLNQLMSSLCPGWSFASNHAADPDGRIIIIWRNPIQAHATTLRLKSPLILSGQMIALPKGKPPTLLSYLAWQAMIYWLWNERNARLHSNTFRSADTIYTTIYRQLKNKIQSFRPSNPTMSSAMMQLWI
ncbi:hypothetical protein IGI04_003058 [Brassica rapa subsp. trilocularis]|uniref:DUF4283 domain-containing protein n=1 Tax=Brassica rapa subsp. trilocularis TaxID=1813537 RepID=A0ABQ7NZB4_BRACM|nr:hypothetical protein IGI04_003058 [Brassica rapa subsp. trilocularis]